MVKDFIFRGTVADLDPELSRLLSLEDQRQETTINLVASESAASEAIREAMGSTFGNVYAEGYPRVLSRYQSEAEILDTELELARYKRNSDPRYYKGVEYADALEALARRRAAELFAANGIRPEEIYVNVQPLSGAPANSAVYTALLQPGDTLMGLNLNDGGHLSHGASVNRSGKIYRSVPYFVDAETERLDYAAIERIAMDVNPQIIIAGFSAYPMKVDWEKFRLIADRCGAYLLADIAHISGLVATGIHPSPMGIADVITTTTHKSLCGPRGAMILTHRKDLSSKLDRAVFPGEQGGPHLNTMAALALALKLNKSDQFRALQQRVVENASRLAAKLTSHGLRIVAGGTENHLLLVDTKSIRKNGVHLSGDMAARILDVAGIVVNRNTIPGDRGALSPTGLRLGTVWISQLGFGSAEVDRLAEAIATILKGSAPFFYMGQNGKRLLRAKVKFQALRHGRNIVRSLRAQSEDRPVGDLVEVRGEPAARFLDFALTSDVLGLADAEHTFSRMHADGIDADCAVLRLARDRYHLRFADAETARKATTWLSALSDGYVQFDDLYGKLPGPVVVKTISEGAELPSPEHIDEQAVAMSKPFFVGHTRYYNDTALPEFTWSEPEEAPLRRTPLYDTHVEMGARMIPFGGYEMPVWYTSVGEEHRAVRETAGIFDATHMGVLEASGTHVVEFLDTVTVNDVSGLRVGRSHYTYLLLPDGRVIDDLLVYRRGPDRFMLVVNASNNDKDWAWINAVNEGRVMIDRDRKFAKILHPVTLRDLREPAQGEECRVDIAVQGPRSLDIILALCTNEALAERIKTLRWSGLTEGNLGGFDVIVSRTGYTGERTAFELFVHPDSSVDLWRRLLEVGEPYGLRPCGLAARDSTRTEAGLPLYGHELAGELNLNPADAGFGSFVKLWKPFFIGRSAFITHEESRERIVIRFRMNEKGVRRPELGDPVLDRRGKMVGRVTSCAIDREGYLLGQALVPIDLSHEGTELQIYQLGGGKRPIRVPAQLKIGARLPAPDTARVLTRFPTRS